MEWALQQPPTDGAVHVSTLRIDISVMRMCTCVYLCTWEDATRSSQEQTAHMPAAIHGDLIKREVLNNDKSSLEQVLASAVSQHQPVLPGYLDQ